MQSHHNFSNPVTRPVCCTSCSKRIQSTNLKRVFCPICKGARHLKCSPFNFVVNDITCPVCINNLLCSRIETDSELYSTVFGRPIDDNSLIDRQLLSQRKFELKCDLTSTSLTADDDRDADANYYNMLFNNPIKYHETPDLNKIIPLATDMTPQFLMHLNDS